MRITIVTDTKMSYKKLQKSGCGPTVGFGICNKEIMFIVLENINVWMTDRYTDRQTDRQQDKRKGSEMFVGFYSTWI